MSRSLFVRTIPMPLRKDIIELYQQGLSTAEISNQLQVSRAWARRVWQDFRDHGTVKNATTRRRTPKWERWAEQIRAAVEGTLSCSTIRRLPPYSLDSNPIEQAFSNAENVLRNPTGTLITGGTENGGRSLRQKSSPREKCFYRWFFDDLGFSTTWLVRGRCLIKSRDVSEPLAVACYRVVAIGNGRFPTDHRACLRSNDNENRLNRRSLRIAQVSATMILQNNLAANNFPFFETPIGDNTRSGSSSNSEQFKLTASLR